MDVKELEFIRDFVDDLSNLSMNINDLTKITDIEYTDEPPTIETITAYAWSLRHHMDILKKLFETFKEQVDAKYWHEWKRKYPHMPNSKEESEKQLEETWGKK